MPFGEVRTEIGTIAQSDFAFTGQRSISMLSIMDYIARNYDPAIGRFLQPDSIVPSPANPQSWNRFSYTQNNPIKYSDPSGHLRIEEECGMNGEDCGGGTPSPSPLPPQGGGGGSNGSSNGGGNGGVGGGNNDDVTSLLSSVWNGVSKVGLTLVARGQLLRILMRRGPIRLFQDHTYSFGVALTRCLLSA